MKQLLFKLSTVLCAALLFSPETQAQEEKEKIEAPKEIEHITITRKGDTKEKVTIVVDGDKITVNGKPSEELKGGDITVRKSKIKSGSNLTRMNGPGAMTWNNQDGAYSLFSGNENRAMLGVITDKTDEGLKINEVTKESAAEKAGLKEGDVITKIDDKKIENADELSKLVTSKKPGDKVSITYLRDKKENKVTAELSKWKGVDAYAFTPGSGNFDFKMPEMNFREMEIPRVQGVPMMRYGQPSGGQPKLGLSVQDTDEGKGVKVTDVDDESNAGKAGIKENDIITHVNDKEVNNADEIARLVRENKDKPAIRLQVKRNGKSQNIEIKVPRKLKTADL